MSKRYFQTTEVDIALATERCPVASGDAEKNEVGQDCPECIRACIVRGQLCDSLHRGHGYDIDPLLDARFTYEQGWEGRVLRRAGSEAT